MSANVFTEDDVRHFRLSALIVNMGTAVARTVFDGNINYWWRGGLQAALNGLGIKQQMLDYLNPPPPPHPGVKRTPKLLNQQQFDKLYPPRPQLPRSDNFDLTLLMFLFRNLLGYPPPGTGNWNDYPHTGDISTSADLVRLRLMRNTAYAHINSTQIPEGEFNQHWTEMENALVRLDPTSQPHINRYKQEKISQLQYEEYKTEIRQLMESDLSDLQSIVCNIKKFVKEKHQIVGSQLSVIQESLKQITDTDPTPVLDVLEKLPTEISRVIAQNLRRPLTEILCCVRNEADSVRAHITENTNYMQAMVTENTHVIKTLVTAGAEAVKYRVTAELNARLPDADRGCRKKSLLQSISQHEREEQLQQHITENYLQNTISDLKSYYRKRYNKIPFIPWDDTSKIRLDDIYVPLKLEENKDEQWKQVSGETFRNIEELISRHDRRDGDRETPVKLIIQGNPGSGKSTSCYKLVYDWIKSKSVLADRYELVILLKARGFLPDQDLFKKITDTIPDYYEENCKELRDILRQKKVLMIIDGYDELGDKINQTQLNKLLDGTLYHKCDLIVTTRHWCTDHLKKRGCFDEIFTVCNFDKEDTKCYVSKFFTHYVKNENKDVVVNFITEVYKKEIPNLLEQPLTCLFLCIVWQDKGDGEKLPETRAQIYDQVMQVMKATYKKKVGDEFMNDTFNTLLNSLSKLAFEKLAEEHSILQFERKDLRYIYKIDVELACAIGILVKADPPADGKKTLMVCDYYTFPHFTFQEFLAARYLFHSEVDLHQTCEAIKPEDEMCAYENIFYFFFGHLSIESDKDITEGKLDRVNQMAYIIHTRGRILGNERPGIEEWKASGCNDRFPWAVLNNVVIEYFAKSITSSVHELCFDKLRIAQIPCWDPSAPIHESVCEYFKSSASQCQADLCFSSVCQKLAQVNTLKDLSLAYIACDCDSKGSSLGNLLAVSKDLERVEIHQCDLNANDTMVMAPHLSNLNALIELILYAMSLGGSVGHIIENLCETIEFISIGLCGISSEDAKIMAPKLKRLTLLTEFDISGNPLEHSAIDIIENLIPSIQRLDMNDCGISSLHAERMAPKLSRLTLLTVFQISGNPLEQSAIDIIENLIPSIQRLDMYNCDISSLHAERMAPKLSRLTLLTVFKISGNPLGHSAIDIIENLSPSMQKLRMDGCGLSVEDIKSLAPHLQRLTSLKTLWLKEDV